MEDETYYRSLVVQTNDETQVLIPLDLYEDLGENPILTFGCAHDLRLYTLEDYVRRCMAVHKPIKCIRESPLQPPFPCRFVKKRWLVIPEPMAAYADLQGRDSCTIVRDKRKGYLMIAGDDRQEQSEVENIYVTDDVYCAELPGPILAALTTEADEQGDYAMCLTPCFTKQGEPIIKLWGNHHAQTLLALQRDLAQIDDNHYICMEKTYVNSRDGTVFIPTSYLRFANIYREAAICKADDGVYILRSPIPFKDTEEDEEDWMDCNYDICDGFDPMED